MIALCYIIHYNLKMLHKNCHITLFSQHVILLFYATHFKMLCISGSNTNYRVQRLQYKPTDIVNS